MSMSIMRFPASGFVASEKEVPSFFRVIALLMEIVPSVKSTLFRVKANVFPRLIPVYARRCTNKYHIGLNLSFAQLRNCKSFSRL